MIFVSVSFGFKTAHIVLFRSKVSFDFIRFLVIYKNFIRDVLWHFWQVLFVFFLRFSLDDLVHVALAVLSVALSASPLVRAHVI